MLGSRHSPQVHSSSGVNSLNSSAHCLLCLCVCRNAWSFKHKIMLTILLHALAMLSTHWSVRVKLVTRFFKAPRWQSATHCKVSWPSWFQHLLSSPARHLAQHAHGVCMKTRRSCQAAWGN